MRGPLFLLDRELSGWQKGLSKRRGIEMTNSKYKVGDIVTYINAYGVNWGKRKIVEVTERTGRPCYYIEPTDTPWFAVGEENLYPVAELLA